MKFLVIFLATIGFSIYGFVVYPAVFAESIETFVIHPHLFDCRDIDRIPQKCMVYKQQNQNPFEKWDFLYVPIEGFDYKEWNRYIITVKITDVENPTSHSTSKKYELAEILGQESFPPHDPYKGMCAPGFVATTAVDCRFNFRCGPEWSAERICEVNGKPQPYLKPLQQVRNAGIAEDDVICAEHLKLIFNNDGDSPVCVTPETRDILIERDGWTKYIPKANAFEQITEPELYTKDSDIPEARLFFEKYPQAVILVDQVGYANHYKQYMHVEQTTGDVVGLFIMKNISTGQISSIFRCPPTSHHSDGYEVRGTFDIIEYLRNYDCLKDDNVGRFELTNGPERMEDVQDLENMRKSVLDLEFDEAVITVLISDETYFGAMTSFEFTTIPVSSLVQAHDMLPETSMNDRMMSGSMLSEIVKAGTYIKQNDEKEFWYTIGGIESQVITIELQDHEYDRIVFVSDKNEKLIEQINKIVNSRK